MSPNTSTNTQVDEATVRQFIELLSIHVRDAVNGGPSGVFQIYRLSPIDESTVPSRFDLDDIEAMVATAVGDAAAGFNVYMEARTVRPDLRGNRRGAFEDTAWVFGLVIDSDADKGKGGEVKVRPSLIVETSPGNFHYWYLFTRAISANQAKLIGEVIRANSGTDQDTGVITQGYRVAGTPNYPTRSKQARGRTAIEPTRIFEYTGRLWDPDELLAAYRALASTSATSTATAASTAPSGVAADEATLPDDLLEDIREGGPGKKSDKTRSALFQDVVSQLRRRNWSVDEIVELFERYPNGVAAKYQKRLRREVERSYRKALGGAPPRRSAAGLAAPVATSGSTSTSTSGVSGSAPGTAPGASAAGQSATSQAPRPHILPTIRLADGQLPRAVTETELALLATGAPIFSRAGELMYPVAETMTAADGRKMVMARLRAFTTDSFIEPVAEAAIFQRYSVRRSTWTDTDPPIQLVRMVLSRERRWAFPRVSGIITTPTLRCDGSLLVTPGYDPRSELYLLPGLQMPAIPDRPTREQAEAALKFLRDLFGEFSFTRKDLDGSVAISGLLTAQLRGAFSTAPVYLVRADTPGTGKSYLVDLISMIASGRLCPVITASKNAEETEKRLGSILLSGIPLVSLDNCEHDLGGELLCQLSERPIVKIRILGRSEMPDCECHTAVFATGNNITFKRDMIRRGLVCNLQALDERPELRAFQRDALDVVATNRGAYVAAALTIVRAYFAAGAPKVCGPLGSYPAWSKMVRSPLVWLGEPDPIKVMEDIRDEDPDLANIRELFELWLGYDLGLDTEYTTACIIGTACVAPGSNNYAPQTFKQLLLRIAAAKGNPDTVSSERLGWWLRRISGRIVSATDASGLECRFRLLRGHAIKKHAYFKLVKA